MGGVPLDSEVGKLSEWMSYVIRRKAGETPEMGKWAETLSNIIVPLAAKDASATMCYWALIGYCRLQKCELPSEWVGAVAACFNDLLPRFKQNVGADAVSTHLLAKTVSLLLELSVNFAGESAAEWDRHLLFHD
jgi:hypothetical protein